MSPRPAPILLILAALSPALAGCVGDDPVTAVQMKALEEATRRAAPLACPNRGHDVGQRLRDSELLTCARDGAGSVNQSRRVIARLIKRAQNATEDPEALGDDAGREVVQITDRLQREARRLGESTTVDRKTIERVGDDAAQQVERGREKLDGLLDRMP